MKKKETKKVNKTKDIKKVENEEKENDGIAIGLCLGLCIGTGVGVATNQLAIWLPIGMCLGLAIGTAFSGEDEDKKNKKKK